MGCWAFLRFMPFSVPFTGMFTAFLSYGVAISNDHISVFLPYVSDTGAKPPESCIFSLCLGFDAIILFFIYYIRYREVSYVLEMKPTITIKPFWNKFAFGLGSLSSFGLAVVAAFQEINEFTTHILGAMVCFCASTGYIVLQTIFTRKTFPEEKALFIMRIIFTSINVVCLVLMFAPVPRALALFKGDDFLKWSPEDGGFALHVVSALSEWIAVLSYLFFIFTLHWDFMKFDMESPVIRFRTVISQPRRLFQRTRSGSDI